MLSLASLLYPNTLVANQQVITDDGREVLLMDDGSWKFLSNDRFANTGDGRRVRLKADGSWVYMGNAPLASDQQVRTLELDVKLKKAVIETHEIKVQKNKRVKSQTVFYLELALSPQAGKAISIDENDISLVKVNDNLGRDYPVLSIQPNPMTLKPDADTVITLRTDGSPQWWKNVKTMRIEFSPPIFGNQDPVVLTGNIDDFQKKKVEGFDSE